eukprot:sb/3478118/
MIDQFTPSRFKTRSSSSTKRCLWNCATVITLVMIDQLTPSRFKTRSSSSTKRCLWNCALSHLKMFLGLCSYCLPFLRNRVSKIDAKICIYLSIYLNLVQKPIK